MVMTSMIKSPWLEQMGWKSPVWQKTWGPKNATCARVDQLVVLGMVIPPLMTESL